VRRLFDYSHPPLRCSKRMRFESERQRETGMVSDSTVASIDGNRPDSIIINDSRMTLVIST
jgi:hypothetical protein